MIREKVKTGIAGLDDMLEGGLIPGRPYVVSGASGTGKTTLAMQFLREGAKAGEDVMYVALDEPPNEVKSNLSAFGWDLERIRVFDATCDIMGIDKTPVRDVSTERKVVSFAQVSNSIRRTSDKGPADITINTLQELLKQEMRVRKYSRVVIDSVTSLRFFYIKTSEEYAAVQSFFRLMSDLGITSILTVHLPEVSKMDAESHIARGEIRLHKWFNGRGLVRGITIEKYRGSTHDTKMRLIKIDSDGISVKMMGPQKIADTCGPEGELTGPKVTPTAETDLPPPPPPPSEVLPPPPGSTPGAGDIDRATHNTQSDRSGGV
jgi:KaiC/GvpD/RAD55 family RecA-like ATPase